MQRSCQLLWANDLIIRPPCHQSNGFQNTTGREATNVWKRNQRPAASTSTGQEICRRVIIVFTKPATESHPEPVESPPHLYILFPLSSRFSTKLWKCSSPQCLQYVLNITQEHLLTYLLTYLLTPMPYGSQNTLASIISVLPTCVHF
jgi:hypothetical protein